jgi:hypothetical protein
MWMGNFQSFEEKPCLGQLHIPECPSIKTLAVKLDWDGDGEVEMNGDISGTLRQPYNIKHDKILLGKARSQSGSVAASVRSLSNRTCIFRNSTI